MHIARTVPEAGFAVLTAGEDHGKFCVKGDEALQHGGRHADRGQGHRRIIAGGEPHLTLAVIAETARLQNGRPANLLQRRNQIVEAIDRCERRRVPSKALDEPLLRQPILRDAKGAGIGPNFANRGQGRDRSFGHVFELIGYDVNRLCKRRQRRLVIIGAARPA